MVNEGMESEKSDHTFGVSGAMSWHRVAVVLAV